MKRRRIISVLIAVIFVGVVVAVVWPKPEPEYKGKKLGQWIEMTMGPERGRAEGEAAVMHIGTNALPWLLGWVRYEPSELRSWVFSGLKKRLPQRITQSSSFDDFAAGEGERRRFHAEVCFLILGEKAGPGVPELLRLMFQTNSAYVSRNAAWALTCVGKDAVPALIAALENRTRPGRQMAVRSMSMVADRFGTNVVPLVPVLIGFMNETNATLTGYVAVTLGRMHLEPDLAVPALLSGLQHQNGEVRFAAASALSEFGQLARSAVPVLSNASKTDPYPFVREAAHRALVRIAPEVLETNRVDHF